MSVNIAASINITVIAFACGSSSAKIGVWGSSAGGAAPKPVQGAVNIDQTAQSRSQVKETAKGLSEVMTNVKELSQELKNQQSFKTTNKESNSKLTCKPTRHWIS